MGQGTCADIKEIAACIRILAKDEATLPLTKRQKVYPCQKEFFVIEYNPNTRLRRTMRKLPDNFAQRHDSPRSTEDGNMMQKETKRSIKSAQTQKKIMEAAKQLLFQHGYENTSIQRICQAAQVTTGTFYHFFQSKHNLFACIAERTQTVNDRWCDFDYENDSPYRLAENYSQRVSELIQILTPENLFSIYFSPCGGNKLFLSKEHPTYQYLWTALAGFQKAGKLRADIPVEQMYRELTSCHLGAFYFAYTTGAMDTCRKDLEAVLKHLLDFYMRLPATADR